MNRSSADIPKYLWDAHQAAERIHRFTAGRTVDDYLEDDMLRSAVERQFQAALMAALTSLLDRDVPRQPR